MWTFERFLRVAHRQPAIVSTAAVSLGALRLEENLPLSRVQIRGFVHKLPVHKVLHVVMIYNQFEEVPLSSRCALNGFNFTRRICRSLAANRWRFSSV